MSRIVFVGGGFVGTCAAMMLARDGHEVTVLERDPAPPPGPSAAWQTWERRGVNQFREIHFLLAGFRATAELELPELPVALRDAGALAYNFIDPIPATLTGGRRDDDDRFSVITARRPVAESVVAAMAAATPGLTVKRGVGVRGFSVGASHDGIVHIDGVHTDDNERIAADLVVDAGGRRSASPGWLRELGSPGPVELIEDCGFVYYARHFRSSDGSVPFAFGGLLQPYGSISVLTLPADNGTWGVGIITSSKDTAMRALFDTDTWMRVIASYPLVAHWIDAEPITDVSRMSKIEDRRRDYVVGDKPVATGLVALADAWACTNPSLGRGISIGIRHAASLRAALRENALDDPEAFALHWHQRTVTDAGRYLDEALAFDRHRLAEIDAEIDGRTYETDDADWQFEQALANGGVRDPDLLRYFLDLVNVLEPRAAIMRRPGVVERAHSLAEGGTPPGPNRAELIALLGN